MRKFYPLCLLLVCLSWVDSPLVADEPRLERLPPLAAVLVNQYHAELAMRAEEPKLPAEQPLATTARLVNYSGVLAQSEFTLLWDNTTNLPQLWQDNEQVKLDVSYDAQGRITFANTERGVKGLIDTFGTSGVMVNINNLTWFGSIVFVTEDGATPHGPDGTISPSAPMTPVIDWAALTQCTCKGSNTECPDPQNDCGNNSPCNGTNPLGDRVNGKCYYFAVPVE